MIHKSQENNKLYAPMTFNVVYDAVDSYNNAATCAFTVHIKGWFTLNPLYVKRFIFSALTFVT